MERLSKNGLDLIKLAADKVKGVWGKAFLASLIYVAPLIALCFIPFAGWAISIACFGYLTLGFINYMQQLLKGENPSLKVLFVQKEFAQAILLGIIMAVGVMVGTLLFVVPGVLVIAFYSLSLFVLNEERIVNVTDTLNVAARKMHRNKTAMFAYKVIFYLFYALVGVAALVGMLFAVALYDSAAAWAIVLGVSVMLVAIVLVAIITIYFYAANVIFYSEIVRPVVVTDYALTSEQVKPAPVADTFTEIPVEEGIVAEDAPAAEVKEAPATEEVKPAPAKKPAAKKATTTAKTSTAKKASTTKTASKATTTKTTAAKKATATTTKAAAAKKPAAKKTTTTKTTK